MVNICAVTGVSKVRRYLARTKVDDRRGLPQKAIEIRARRELHEMNCELDSVNRRQQFLMEQVQRDGMNDVLAERLVKLGRRRETVQREIEEWKLKYNL